MKSATLIKYASLVLLAASTAFAEDKVALETKLPNPLLVGTPVPVNLDDGKREAETRRASQRPKINCSSS